MFQVLLELMAGMSAKSSVLVLVQASNPPFLPVNELNKAALYSCRLLRVCVV